MIFGIGTDIAKTSRFKKWIDEPDMFLRFFNENELFSGDLKKHCESACCHYAARFAAKEAFVKAFGTGFCGFELNDFYVKKNAEGQPFFEFGEKTKRVISKRIDKNYRVHLSISHEKEFATAFVIIEILE